MKLRERLAKLISDRLEGHGGLIFVSAKKFILELGCNHADQAISEAHKAWDKIVQAIDIPLVSEEAERKVEDEVWQRIELGLRQFKDAVCAPKAEGTFAAEDLHGMAEDPTLPTLS